MWATCHYFDFPFFIYKNIKRVYIPTFDSSSFQVSQCSNNRYYNMPKLTFVVENITLQTKLNVLGEIVIYIFVVEGNFGK